MLKLNGVQITPTIFPDKTSQVWKVDAPVYAQNIIDWDFESEAEFMHLAQLKHLVMAQGSSAELHLSYLPYGRQDKPVENDKTFALRTFVRLLNALEFTRVVVFDPHSTEILFRLNAHVVCVWPKEEIKYAFRESGADLIVFPDEGAKQRYAHHVNLPVAFATKERDQATGQILSTTLSVELKDSDCNRKILIVDDICDGGATFIALAKALHDAGATEIHLYVSHGLFTKGTQVLRDAGIKRIFTKNGEIQ